MKPRRKSQVTPAMARDWLRRADELGEKPPEIARADGYDVRTVRKKIAEARQQQESRETRQIVVRSALEKHFSSICSFAKRFRTELSRPEPQPISVVLTGDPLWRSLKEHLPRSPIWSNVEKWETIETAYEQAADVLRERIKKEALLKAGMPFSSSLILQGVYEGWFEAMVTHAKFIARGELGLNGVIYRQEETSYGIRLNRGAYTLALTSKDSIPMLSKAFDAMLNDMEKWPEYMALKKNTEMFLSVRSVIEDELTTIIMRRVLPGRCHYCPY